jgi:hypothetical protein
MMEHSHFITGMHTSGIVDPAGNGEGDASVTASQRQCRPSFIASDRGKAISVVTPSPLIPTIDASFSESV